MQENLSASGFFNALCGSWKLDRKIIDHKTRETKTAIGTATWEKTKSLAVLHYREAGKLILLDGKYDFLRKYSYQLDSNKINILFEDGVDKGKLFLSLILEKGNIVNADHLCNQDHYQVSLILPNYFNQQFYLKFCVVGPKKDYTVITHYIFDSEP